MPLAPEAKTSTITKFRTHETDTGSPEVQIALLSQRIEYLTEHRIFHAQRMLLTTSMSVLDVAEAAGFGSLSHFNRAFQKYCGRSPREFRKSNTLELERPSSRRSRS